MSNWNTGDDTEYRKLMHMLRTDKKNSEFCFLSNVST